VNKSINQAQIKLLDELCAVGIPLNPDILQESRAASDDFKIFQSPDILESGVYGQVGGETFFMVGIVLFNGSDRVVRLQACRLQIPWHEPRFRWMKNPLGKIPREYCYWHPAFGPAGFEPDEVLNHRFDRGLKLFPDDSIDGLLFGVGESPLPEEYIDRQRIRTRLTIFESRGNCHFLDVNLMAHPAARPKVGHARCVLSSKKREFAETLRES